MNKKAIVLFILVTALTFSNSLFNNFVGDDKEFILENPFYHSLKNIPLIFEQSYLTGNTISYSLTKDEISSGEVAYRLVLSLTYFFDYWLWKTNAFGFHLHNLTLHIFNVILVYFLLIRILKNNRIAFFSALLFGIHPVQTEAVNNIGYRTDILFSFFTLLSLHLYFTWINTQHKSGKYYFLSHLFYFLALFTKEAGLVMPILILAYHGHFQKQDLRISPRSMFSRYGGYVLISLFYVFIYFKVFRNITIASHNFFGENIFTHATTMLWIFSLYLRDLCLPFFVKIIPPLYAPDIQSYLMAKAVSSVLLLVLFLRTIQRSYHTEKMISFFLLWYLIYLLPVANFIPLDNPMSHRFLYLPTIGFFAAVGILIEKLCNQLKNLNISPKIGTFIKLCIVGICINSTITLNTYWKNNISVADILVENYPKNIKSHRMLGLECFKRGHYQKAGKLFTKCVTLGSKDPRDFHLLGIALLDKPGEADTFFKRFPRYGSPYVVLGRKHVLNKEYEQALPLLEKSIELTPTYIGIGYLLQVYMRLDQPMNARSLIELAKKFVHNEGQIRILQMILEQQRNSLEPIDIGL